MFVLSTVSMKKAYFFHRKIIFKSDLKNATKKRQTLDKIKKDGIVTSNYTGGNYVVKCGKTEKV